MQGKDSSGPGETRGRLEKSDGIDLMDQDVPDDHEIERYRSGKGIDRSLREGDMQESACLSPLSRNSEDLRIAIDADDQAGHAN